jgi:hypothetical protein
MALGATYDPVEARMAEIRSFLMPCPLTKMEKSVPPMTCRNCSERKICPQVQALLGADKEYAIKFKGTMLESAMKRVAQTKKQIANFILDIQQ